MFSYVSNPPNPWAANSQVEWIGEPPTTKLEIYEERARSILSKNDSPDLSFDWSVNPYRGCFHGCAYCYARPSHQYLSFGAGTDFDRRLVVKLNAAELLQRAFDKPRWTGDPIVFSGNTDCYQPLEAHYGLTRTCLEVCLKYGNPVTIITKSALIRRDVELLAQLHRRAGVLAFISIPFRDDETGRLVEPHASAISQRFKTLRQLADAGVPCGVAVAPLIPGLNDSHVASILEQAASAGASRAFTTFVRLAGETRLVFAQRIQQAFPERASKIMSSIDQMKGSSAFGARMAGQGPRWQIVSNMFDVACRKHGFERGERQTIRTGSFRRPGQFSLFDD